MCVCVYVYVYIYIYIYICIYIYVYINSNLELALLRVKREECVGRRSPNPGRPQREVQHAVAGGHVPVLDYLLEQVLVDHEVGAREGGHVGLEAGGLL